MDVSMTSGEESREENSSIITVASYCKIRLNTFRFVRRISAEKVHSKHSPNVENMKTREYPYRHGLYRFSQSEGIKYHRI